MIHKIHKPLSKVPARPFMSNYGAPTVKVFEFLDSHMQPVTRKG